MQFDFVTRDRCPVCGDGGAVTRYSKPYGEDPVASFIRWRYAKSTDCIAEASYTVAECRRCDLLYQVEVGAPAFQEELYTRWIDDPDGPEDCFTYRRDQAHQRESRDAHEILTAARYLQIPLNELRTLDFGMGWALWAEIAKGLGCDSWGADLSPPRIEFAESRGIRIAPFHNLPSERFDFINTEQVCEHLAEPFDQCAELVRALRPGGVLKISVPSAEPARTDRIEAALRDHDMDAIMPVHPLEHVNGFRKKSIRHLADRLGLVIVQPRLSTRFAFLRTPDTISLRRPKQAIKELVRPFVHWRMPRNLYFWLRKPV